MPEENMPLDEQEKLRTENEFMKMKLMLERGATFANGSNEHEIPMEIEHLFLNNIINFEKQFDEGKRITVFEKIGKPLHFKPLSEIPISEVDKAWQELSDYLDAHGIGLDVCSPNVNNAELYRFAIEELFPHEMDDINIAGMMTCFIYDEFHPDHAYDTTRVAVNDCIKAIFCKEPLKWIHYFHPHQIQLNERKGLRSSQFKNIINQFKMAYDTIDLRSLDKIDCTLDERVSTVTGQIVLTLVYGNQKEELTGNWKVEFENEREEGSWTITRVEIPGINF